MTHELGLVVKDHKGKIGISMKGESLNWLTVNANGIKKFEDLPSQTFEITRGEYNSFIELCFGGYTVPNYVHYIPKRIECSTPFKFTRLK